MDVILHIGAQRTASTTLQAYLNANSGTLKAHGVGFWGPRRTRNNGVLTGILPEKGPLSPAEQFAEARARVLETIARSESRGIETLIVSDENMLGTVRRNLRRGALYPDAFSRLERHARAFDGMVVRIVVSIRALDAYWASAWSFGVGRGQPLPTHQQLNRIAHHKRSWRDVIVDAGRAFPGADIQVHAHETHAGRPEHRLEGMTDAMFTAPMKDARLWLHRAPDLGALRIALAQRGEDPAKLPAGEGRWFPFDAGQASALRETYADDIFWLRAGGGGFAHLIEEDPADKADQSAAAGHARGQDDDGQDGTLAGTG